MSAASIRHALYFINLSATTTTNVNVVCRIRDRDELIVADVVVGPLDYGEWSPGCACDGDYTLWCRMEASEPIAAHGIKRTVAATRDDSEYVGFFLGE